VAVTVRVTSRPPGDAGAAVWPPRPQPPGPGPYIRRTKCRSPPAARPPRLTVCNHNHDGRLRSPTDADRSPLTRTESDSRQLEGRDKSSQFAAVLNPSTGIAVPAEPRSRVHNDDSMCCKFSLRHRDSVPGNLSLSSLVLRLDLNWISSGFKVDY
jgi:hypothetical protein